jgi:hypothetical protein
VASLADRLEEAVKRAKEVATEVDPALALSAEEAAQAGRLAQASLKPVSAIPPSTWSAKWPTVVVEVKKIRIDPGARLVADPGKLARNGPFQWEKYTGHIEVYERGGVYYLDGGVTTLESAKTAGVTHIPVIVKRAP